MKGSDLKLSLGFMLFAKEWRYLWPSYVFIDQLKQQQTKTYTLHIINYMKNVAFKIL